VREFGEELGLPPPTDPSPVPLGELRQPSGKRVIAFAMEGDLDVDPIESNPFSIEWPPGSGSIRAFPEVDRAGWFDLDEARRKLLRGQVGFLDRLADLLKETWER
jgi:predicted NUDIX family NTP pyrophosphohydrolase